jgi:hypothetical protein
MYMPSSVPEIILPDFDRFDSDGAMEMVIELLNDLAEADDFPSGTTRPARDDMDAWIGILESVIGSGKGNVVRKFLSRSCAVTEISSLMRQ